MRKRYFLLLLSIITIFGASVRLWRLNSLPLPPNGDELAFAYYGWSLFNFGSDEYGNKFPIYFASVGDYKYPLLAYFNMLPAAMFGLSENVIRFWSVVSGIALIPLIFTISYLTFSSVFVSLFSSLFIALAPWSITLSRVGYESNLSIFLSSLAILFLICGIKHPNNRCVFLKISSRKSLLIAFILFFLASFCYAAQRVFIPSFLFGVFLILLFSKKTDTKLKNSIFTIFIILTLICAIALLPWQARGRASGVVAKIPQEKIEKDIFYDGISPIRIPLFLTRVYHNKITTSVIEGFGRYISYFNPEFIFFKGDRSPETTPDVGIVLHIELIFVLLGLFYLLKSKNNISAFILLVWFLAGPCAAALTQEGPHLVRAGIMYPPIAIFSGYGVFNLLTFIKNKRIRKTTFVLIILLILLNFSFVWHQIFVHKPVRQPWYSDQGKKELVTEILARKNNFNAVAMKETHYIFFLFYGKVSPSEFLTDSEILPESKEKQWERVKRWSNIYFGMPFDCPKGGKLNVLYVCKGSEIPQNAKVLKTIYFLDGIPAYSLIEFYPFSKAPPIPQELPPMLKYMVEKETKYPDGIIPEDYPSLW